MSMKENENGLWTVDTVDTPLFGGAYINKDGITLRGAILFCIGKQSPLTVKRSPLTVKRYSPKPPSSGSVPLGLEF